MIPGCTNVGITPINDAIEGKNLSKAYESSDAMFEDLDA